MVALTHKGVTYGAPYDERPEYGMVFRKVFLATGGRPLSLRVLDFSKNK